ncbi:restriction endonuclease subunit S [Cyanothece sp. BG0011]|uniref:restriction endonuclease subunit S n=1 Tax=Cyanothece sp. BG0011 TaxID=2082950 RepID=UPI001E53AD27|nr:restriction endonuclease subunit S [Cyanothece sp. BG0011]
MGLIPDDWEVKRIKNIAPLQRGFDLPTSKLKRGDYPVVYSNGITNYHNTFMVSAPGVVTGRSGTIGNVHYVTQNYWPHNTALWVTNFYNNHPKYIYYLYKHINLERFCSGSGVPTLNRNDVHDLLIAVPPTKTEQEKIAAALSDIDELIESLEELITKKRQIKQGTMQELLTGKRRLKGFEIKQGYKQTEIGLIPEDWEVKRLGDIADKNKNYSFTGGPFGSNLKSSDYTSNGIRIIQLQNIGDGEFKNEYELFTSYSKADELLTCNIYPGDIILSKMGDPVARACIVPNFNKRYLMCSDGIRLAVDNKYFNTYFIYTVINSSIFRNKAENASTGSTRKRIGLTELRHLELPCPLLEEQKAIAEILTDMDEEIQGLEERLKKTRQIKQGMMQELLTGRIRLI